MNHPLFPLYELVQTSGLFPDSKFFPDCTPKLAPAAILEAFETARKAPDFDLKSFIAAHFTFPETPISDYQSSGKSLPEHLNNLWDWLTRMPSEPSPNSSLLALPNRYVVPGGRFQEMYYWDSYFTMLGLQVSGREDIITEMVENFAHLIRSYGHIPNGNRTYYLSRSQPPLFALMVQLLADIKGEAVLLTYRQELEKEYEFWMNGALALTPAHPEESVPELTAYQRVVRMEDGTVLNRYWDNLDTPRPEAYLEDVHTAAEGDAPSEETYRHLRAAAESGWDFSSRWLREESNLSSIHTCDILPVDLNCLLYFLEKTLIHAYRQLPDHTPVEVFRDRTRIRKAAILAHFWDAQQGFFVDYDAQKKEQSKALTLAGVLPLFVEIASPEQAKEVAEVLSEHFLQPGGLRTSLSHSGQQWDAPNGWAPLQWMAYQGLIQYGHLDLANQIRNRWMATCEKTFAETGKMMEKYDVENPDAPGGGGEYPNQDGFGWTNGVYLKFRSLGVNLKF